MVFREIRGEMAGRARELDMYININGKFCVSKLNIRNSYLIKRGMFTDT